MKIRYGGWRALATEPLLHFLVLGAIAFALWSRSDVGATRIVIPAGQITRAVAGFTRTHLRAPDATELQQLIESQVIEEVYVREALRLGLDRDDEIIRRRLRQKLEFLTEDLAEQPLPDDAELKKYLQAHATQFGGDATLAFSQIYLNPSRHADLAGDARQLLNRLNAEAGRRDPANLGDTLPLPTDFESTPRSSIATLFGSAFAAALDTLPLSRWTGPIESGYGQHLVLVRRRTDITQPVFEQVREEVARAWLAQQRIEANRRAVAQMRANYDVRVDLPAPTPR